MASKTALERVAKVLAACKRAEEAALAAHRIRAAAARRQAIALRAAGKRIPGQIGRDVTVVDLQAAGTWQAFTDRGARHAEAFAAAVDREAEPLAAQLAKTMGRARLVDDMIDKARAEARRLAERREEYERGGYSPSSRFGRDAGSTGSPGTE